MGESVTTPLWGKCEDETHTPKSGNLESSGTPATLELDCRGQNTSPWDVLCTVRKLLRIATNFLQTSSQFEVWSGSYELPKSQESNQTVSRLLLGSPKNKSHSDAGAVEQRKEYYMGEGGGFPRVWAVVSQVSSCCPWLVPTPRVFPKVN